MMQGHSLVRNTEYEKKTQTKKIVPSPLTLAVGRALRRAAKAARKSARMHGTPIYIWKNGKVVAEKP